jgi:hypothetical protein
MPRNINKKKKIEGQAMNAMIDIKYINQKFPLSVLFFDQKFCENLGFSFYEHCE